MNKLYEIAKKVKTSKKIRKYIIWKKNKGD